MRFTWMVWEMGNDDRTVQVVQTYNSTDTNTTQKNSDRSNFFIAVSLSIPILVLLMPILTSVLVDEIFLPRYMN